MAELAPILEYIAAGLTLIVLLYLFIGDNALFRIVSYSFVGVVAGYVFVLILLQVLLPRLLVPLVQSDWSASLVPLILGILLIFKLSPRFSFIGNVSMAFLVGVGAAVAIGGAVFGTIFGQMSATFADFSTRAGLIPTRLVEGLFLLIGTACTLAYFQFGVSVRQGRVTERPRWLERMGQAGQVFIGITLGAAFAGVFASAIAAFLERVAFLINVFSGFF